MTLEEAIKENSKLYCTNCWDTDVLQLTWINPNTDEVYNYVDWEDSSSCLNCSEYFDLSTLEDLTLVVRNKTELLAALAKCENIKGGTIYIKQGVYNNIENILDSWFNDYSHGKYTQVSGNNSHESEDIV